MSNDVLIWVKRPWTVSIRRRIAPAKDDVSPCAVLAGAAEIADRRVEKSHIASSVAEVYLANLHQHFVVMNPFALQTGVLPSTGDADVWPGIDLTPLRQLNGVAPMPGLGAGRFGSMG